MPVPEAVAVAAVVVAVAAFVAAVVVVAVPAVASPASLAGTHHWSLDHLRACSAEESAGWQRCSSAAPACLQRHLPACSWGGVVRGT